jgi:hypothetical protein
VDFASVAQRHVGVLIVGRKRPGFDQDWNRVMRERAGAAMKDLALSTVGADSPIIDDETAIAAIARINAAGCD